MPEGVRAEAEVYRDLLRRILGEIESSAHDHPKVRDAITDALDAADRGEKTLVFCSRIATLEQLRRELDAVWESRILERWRRVYPEAAADDIFDTREEHETRQRGRHSLFQARFHRSQDALYLGLREPYLRTLVPIAEWARERLPSIVEGANRLLRKVRVGKTSAERLDYQLAKRCVEQAAAKAWLREEGAGWKRSEAASRLFDREFLRLGLDLAEDEFENDQPGDEQPRWEISERVAGLVLGRGGSLWERLSGSLDALEIDLRVRVVEQLARYLTYKQVLFLPDLLAEAAAAGLSVEPVESTALVEFLQAFWDTASGRRWVEQLQAFLHYFVQRDPRQKLEILDGPIKTGDFARHTKDGESRERLREAFNTPLYPMILMRTSHGGVPVARIPPWL